MAQCEKYKRNAQVFVDRYVSGEDLGSMLVRNEGSLVQGAARRLKEAVLGMGSGMVVR